MSLIAGGREEELQSIFKKHYVTSSLNYSLKTRRWFSVLLEAERCLSRSALHHLILLHVSPVRESDHRQM